MPVYEVKIITYTRVQCASAEEAEAFAKEAIDTITFEGLEADGELYTFSTDEVDVLKDDEPVENEPCASINS